MSATYAASVPEWAAQVLQSRRAAFSPEAFQLLVNATAVGIGTTPFVAGEGADTPPDALDRTLSLVLDRAREIQPNPGPIEAEYLANVLSSICKGPIGPFIPYPFCR